MPRDKTGHFYYSWYPTIYQADTQHLSLAEDGAYRRLIDHYMLTRSKLLNDDNALARIVGITIEEWKIMKNNITSYFKNSENPHGYLIHNLCEENLLKDASRITKCRTVGKLGGRPPKNGNKKEITRTVISSKPITEQNRTEQSKIEAKASISLGGFEEFWKTYPRKDGKESALKAYKRAIKEGTDHGSITGGASAFRKLIEGEATEKRFIPYAATWLNGRRWEDESIAGSSGLFAKSQQPAGSAGSSNGSGGKASRWIAEGDRLAAKYRSQATQSGGQSEAVASPQQDLCFATPVRKDGS